MGGGGDELRRSSGLGEHGDERVVPGKTTWSYRQSAGWRFPALEFTTKRDETDETDGDQVSTMTW